MEWLRSWSQFLDKNVRGMNFSSLSLIMQDRRSSLGVNPDLLPSILGFVRLECCQ